MGLAMGGVRIPLEPPAQKSPTAMIYDLDQLTAMLDAPGMWLIRGGLRSPVITSPTGTPFPTLRATLYAAFEREDGDERVLSIVKMPNDAVRVGREQFSGMWSALGLQDPSPAA